MNARSAVSRPIRVTFIDTKKEGVIWHDRCHLFLHKEENRGGGSPMNIEILFLASLFLIGTSLLARVAVQGIEQALLATVAEYGVNRARARR
jgi:hypothetical protein